MHLTFCNLVWFLAVDKDRRREKEERVTRRSSHSPQRRRLSSGDGAVRKKQKSRSRSPKRLVFSDLFFICLMLYTKVELSSRFFALKII